MKWLVTGTSHDDGQSAVEVEVTSYGAALRIWTLLIEGGYRGLTLKRLDAGSAA